MSSPVIVRTAAGAYCPAGDFHIDPTRRVPRAVITHAHADHARRGMGRYWCAARGEAVLRCRIGARAPIEPVPFGEPFRLGDAQVSFHPAGHILGSAQVRVEVDGAVWVVAGDYKRAPDPTCRPFEVVPCDVFLTEATFGLPIYRWRDPATVAAEMYAWWQACRARGQAAVLTGYSLGKTQRLLALLRPFAPDAVVALHDAAAAITQAYRDAGVSLLATEPIDGVSDFSGRLVIAPPLTAGSALHQRIGPHETAFASGWIRSGRRRGGDRGFVLSDHADWPALVRTCTETGAARVLVQYAANDALPRALRHRGIPAELFT